jgi:hypothetical protein
MLTSVLSGAATGFSATSTKTALSAAATFFSSTRAQLNEQVYRQLFIGTLLTAIDNDRQEQLLDIMARRRYPVPNDKWDPRSDGWPLELGRFNESSGEDLVSDSGDDSVAVPGPSDPADPSGETEAATAGGPVQEETPVEATAENSSQLAEVSSDVEPEERSRAVTGDDTRRFYGMDEATRDAAVCGSSRCLRPGRRLWSRKQSNTGAGVVLRAGTISEWTVLDWPRST